MALLESFSNHQQYVDGFVNNDYFIRFMLDNTQYNYSIGYMRQTQVNTSNRAGTLIRAGSTNTLVSAINTAVASNGYCEITNWQNDYIKIEDMINPVLMSSGYYYYKCNGRVTGHIKTVRTNAGIADNAYNLTVSSESGLTMVNTQCGLENASYSILMNRMSGSSTYYTVDGFWYKPPNVSYTVAWSTLAYINTTLTDSGFVAEEFEGLLQRFLVNSIYKEGIQPVPVYSPAYTITKAPGSESHATLALSTSSASEGDVVTITATIDRGYAIDGILVLPDSGAYQIVVTRNDNVFTFTMPPVNVTIYCEYSALTPYNIEFLPTTPNAVLVPNKNPAYAGEAVTVTGTSNTGYKIQNAFGTVVNTQTPLTLYRTTTTTWTFSMPASSVTLQCTTSPISSTDPLAPGGESEPSTPGGTGEFDDTTDENLLPPLPSISIADSGMLTVFMPNSAQADAFGAWMWSDLFSTDTFEKLGVNPMEYIISYHMIPLTPQSGETRQLKFLMNTSSVSMPIVAEQYPQLNCGNLQIKEFFGSALDYEPYTQASLYLPYIGGVPIKIDDIMGKTLNIRYRIDAYTGAGIAYILVDDVVMYQYGCFTATQIPITSANYMRYLSAYLPVIGGIVGSAFGGAGGIIGSMLGSTAQQSLFQPTPGEIAKSGLTGLTGGYGVGSAASQMAATLAQGRSGVASVMGSKAMSSRSSGISGPTGNIATEYPYLIIVRPKQSLPREYNHFHGYALNCNYKLSDLTGYVKCSHVDVATTTATDNEVAEIVSLLNGGVYV